jgi:transposase
MPPPYPQEFRDRVLARLDEPGVTVDQVAREFGINRNSVRNWKRARQTGGQEPAASPQREPDAAELRRLRAENARLREERDILKQAAAFFAEEERRRR